MTLSAEQQALLRLSLTDGIGPVTGRGLVEHFGSAVALYSTSKSELAEAPGVGRKLASLIHDTARTDRLLTEQCLLLEQEEQRGHPVRLIFSDDPDYPQPLNHCADAPLVLYARGSLPADAPMIAVVGTRRCTPYAEDTLRYIIGEWAKVCPELVIVSGLAYGVDALGHRLAIENGLRTVAVLAHGLQTIYPAAHRELAHQICATGGALLSEYPLSTKPLPQRFISRNRIVAGLSLGTVVAESPVKGGAMVTASLAFEYGREVYAIPGRLFDHTSEGCNKLIARQKATILDDPLELLQMLGITDPEPDAKGTPLPFEPEDESVQDNPILRELAQHEELSLSDLSSRIGEPVSTISAMLFGLELDGRIRSLPGGRYRLIRR